MIANKVCTASDVSETEEEVFSVTERSSISSTDEGVESADDVHVRPDVVPYRDDNLHDQSLLDEREVATDKLRWILSEMVGSSDSFLDFAEEEGFLEILDEMVSHGAHVVYPIRESRQLLFQEKVSH